jgi:hypothetical protein
MKLLPPQLVDELKRNTAISPEKRKNFTARNKSVPQAEADVSEKQQRILG